ncbi:hypothetical protein SPRG_21468 [Saprolegnia parasitica CBS 223.65]|uniref:RBR-type E3 ubiquitin transferase n=1 Tax=Saprolegnia parasitica (strain CBS 223.65) TaxID=695850 RepID=A0A067BMC7_SAPPC|nr:hypothetical protein SPRG_21468 [Saprolegnia parasitica CBS 223.65]KDO19358.1 hypothetical protein SPRG_21468 [Saprolegnia parasitica CBS 223.65]|eukprot:XP_012209946.1 hypothetical protein SPRG_21468 [Saprolegnia parasitica CBS 223.65]
MNNYRYALRATAPCAICLEERPTKHARHCRQCDTNCCEDCFRDYVTHKIQDGDVAPHQLVCPGHCRRPIPRLVLLVVVSTSLFETYDRLALAYKQRQTGYWFCPRPECGQVLPAQAAHSRRLDCESCQQSSCLDCGGVYHDRPNCDVEFWAWCDAHDVQRCPLCTMMLEKVDGCHRVECVYCYNEFCWRCGIKMDDHRLALCWPRMCMRSEHWLYGPIAPVRFVTKLVFDRPVERAHRCERCDTNCCSNCFDSYLTHKIADGDVAPHQLVCPGSCRQPIPRAVLAQFVSPSYLQKYIRFLTAYELRQRGHRYCPRPQCGQLLPTSTSHKTKIKRRVDCPSCQQSSCRDCGGDYHRWPQCDRQYRSWCHAHAAQRCPQCSTTIEKGIPWP